MDVCSSISGHVSVGDIITRLLPFTILQMYISTFIYFLIDFVLRAKRLQHVCGGVSKEYSKHLDNETLWQVPRCWNISHQQIVKIKAMVEGEDELPSSYWQRELCYIALY